jgi:2-polyprenyl-6-methoxyphenol hydroxylase-like FAD-dependent oxidoreductase
LAALRRDESHRRRAGIGGLTTALALLRHGIDVRVVEQAAELTEIGAGLQICADAVVLPVRLP